MRLRGEFLHKKMSQTTVTPEAFEGDSGPSFRGERVHA